MPRAREHVDLLSRVRRRLPGLLLAAVLRVRPMSFFCVCRASLICLLPDLIQLIQGGTVPSLTESAVNHYLC